METETRHCNGCGKEKPVTDFYVHKTGIYVGKVFGWCRLCEHDRRFNSERIVAKRLQEKSDLAIRKMSNKKCCKRCGLVKDKTEFHKDLDAFDGVQCYCRICNTGYRQEQRLIRNGGKHPREINKDCSQWLGIEVAEKVLAAVFKNVQVMPENNRAFDFICGKGFKIDVKSSCRGHYKNRNDRWSFNIKHNKVADYFLLLAFDSREDLNPEYIWLVPGNVINDKFAINISVTTTDKWKEYEKSIDKVIVCCNTMKGETKDD